MLHIFLPFSLVSLTELCSFCYGLKDLHFAQLSRQSLSLTIKTDHVTSGRNVVDPHGRLRAAQGRMGYIGTLSKDVFEPRTSTGSEAFSLFICLDANKLVLLSFFSLLKTIYPRVSTKSFPSDAKSPLPVDVRRSKTLSRVVICLNRHKF